MNNADLVLQYLKKNKKATSAELYKALGVWRVSDAIYKLRELRYEYIYYGKKSPIPEIKTTMIKVKNHRNEFVYVAQYSLVK